MLAAAAAIARQHTGSTPAAEPVTQRAEDPNQRFKRWPPAPIQPVLPVSPGASRGPGTVGSESSRGTLIDAVESLYSLAVTPHEPHEPWDHRGRTDSRVSDAASPPHLKNKDMKNKDMLPTREASNTRTTTGMPMLPKNCCGASSLGGPSACDDMHPSGNTIIGFKTTFLGPTLIWLCTALLCPLVHGHEPKTRSIRSSHTHCEK